MVVITSSLTNKPTAVNNNSWSLDFHGGCFKEDMLEPEPSSLFRRKWQKTGSDDDDNGIDRLKA